MPSSYREHSLKAPLSAWVECVWMLDAPGRPEGAAPESVFPDGCVEMIVQLDAPARAARGEDTFHLQPPAFLMGPFASTLRLAPAGRMKTLGVRFRPGGAAVFLPFPVDLLGDAEVPVDAVFGAAGARLVDRLAAAPSDAARVSLVEEFLISRLLARGGTREKSPVSFAVRRMLASTRYSVAGLARECGWSPRQLERRFRAETGLSPRLLARIIRFQRVLRALGPQDADWVSVALDCGYADQPHLIRDFRAFTGQTPAAFRRSEPSLATAFVAPERLERFFAG